MGAAAAEIVRLYEKASAAADAAVDGDHLVASEESRAVEALQQLLKVGHNQTSFIIAILYWTRYLNPRFACFDIEQTYNLFPALLLIVGAVDLPDASQQLPPKGLFL